ncbi:MAG: response regulator [Nitrospinae bacterium]|nr:response regulator [Nitrospinota bacterium]
MDRDDAEQGSKGRILVVDDHPRVREILGSFLEGAGFQVRTAPDGPTGVALFSADRFDLILVDFRMPGMTGLEVATLVRRTNVVIPIVLITALAHALEAEVVANAGINRVLSKPFTWDELMSCLSLIPASR